MMIGKANQRKDEPLLLTWLLPVLVGGGLAMWALRAVTGAMGTLFTALSHAHTCEYRIHTVQIMRTTRVGTPRLYCVPVNRLQDQASRLIGTHAYMYTNTPSAPTLSTKEAQRSKNRAQARARRSGRPTWRAIDVYIDLAMLGRAPRLLRRAGCCSCSSSCSWRGL